ncbi:Esterase B1 [Armadillidium nasatum]|uniref:Esterase B1 n=1 Tax=Armadillidium nasatum TaxID=96803 RepID=A0A5N5TP08_9CRUS|nr:Esterase B1 [Armadillidium nasatum]
MFIKSLSMLYCIFLYISQLLMAAGDVFDEVPLVRVKQGLIKGIKENSTEGKDFYSYLGIPYAEPPKGNLRFKAPIPKASWEGILDGTKMPPNQREEKLPVMVFIHGGGFVSLRAANYSPYVLMNRDIVLVVIQYRLGIFGSNGLFNRAILQSGTAFCPWASNNNHRKFAIEAGREFGCFIDNGTEKYLECMQSVNPRYLILAAEKTNASC